MLSKRFSIGIVAIFAVLCLSVLVAYTGVLLFQKPSKHQATTATGQPLIGGALVEAASTSTIGFGSSVVYQAPTTTINPDIAKDFDLSKIQNIQDMQKAYGITFSSDDLALLAKQKFLVKPITDTSIHPNSNPDAAKEFVQLYHSVNGLPNPLDRKPENAVFYSSDVFFNTYNNLYTELLKEMENREFYPAMRDFSKRFFEEANKKVAATMDQTEKMKWTKIRNYFAIPYAILSTAAQPLTAQDYQGKDGRGLDPNIVQDAFKEKDAKVDTIESVSAFVKDLKLDAESQKAILTDLTAIYNPEGPITPEVFKTEYDEYTQIVGKTFKIDVTQFTPRATYTSSSLRRQYFRGMKWYIMVPFFLKSPTLTTYSYGIAQLMAENPDALTEYNKLESTIGFMVGTSDDLMPVDYLSALQSGKGAQDPSQAAMEYLIKARDPKIKDLAASYPASGVENSDEVRLDTKGMRLFSGKFIIDSYWTGMLTQGDEASRPGYDQKLPPMASSLEVMGLLGSDYAKSQISKLDFYSEKNSKAINQMMTRLSDEESKMTDADWTANIYFAWMWTIKSLFSWQQINHAVLPQFMQSSNWEVKTLMTASGFWTELRHATILYAKQSFAELGGGGGDCDPREVPPPPKSYIEPQLEAYARLSYLAKRTNAGLKEEGFDLQNMRPLENFINLMDKVQAYTQKELQNQTLVEKTISQDGGLTNDGKPCITHSIDGTSDWETLRLGIVDGLSSSLPVPTEGPILTAKDKRAAVVADVHTGGDSDYPTHILYEGEGIPNVIFTAVNDANGPRLTIGFMYSHYEFTKGYGGKRMTDEDWQTNFYKGDSDTYNAYNYTSSTAWPALNNWYKPLFNLK